MKVAGSNPGVGTFFYQATNRGFVFEHFWTPNKDNHFMALAAVFKNFTDE